MNVPYANWIELWKWVLIIGLGLYFLVVAAVIPLGALDIRKLFKRLDEELRQRQSGSGKVD
jgi:hypothetical protein